MKVKSNLSSLPVMKVLLSTAFLCSFLLSSIFVDASCPNRHSVHRPRSMLQHRLHRHNHHHPMQYYYPSYGRGSSFGTLMNEIFSMPMYFNTLARQHEEQVSRFLVDQPTAPRYAITEGDDAFELALDVPGARPEDLSIQLEEGGTILRISGSKYHRSTRASGELISYEFDQSFTMDNDNVDVDEMSVSLSGGVLRVIAPKVKKVKEETRKLPIEYKEEKEEMEVKVSGDEKMSRDDHDGDVDHVTKMEENDAQENKVVNEKVEEETVGVEEVDGLTITEDE